MTEQEEPGPIQIYMWGCDDECHCLQPRVLRKKHGPFWETLEAGPFLSDSDEYDEDSPERQAQVNWLVEAKKRYRYQEEL